MPDITAAEMRTQILQSLYAAQFSPERGLSLRGLCEKEGWDRSAFEKIVKRLLDESSVGVLTLDAGGTLQPFGILLCEREGIAPGSLHKRNTEARLAILRSLQRWYDTRGAYAFADYHQLASDTGLDITLVGENVQVLIYQRYVNDQGSLLELTGAGHDLLERLEAHEHEKAEFGEVEKLPPQTRGLAFQHYLGRLIERSGWSVEPSVRTINEEIDLVVSRGREYFLLEAKWQTDPVEAKVIRELLGKLQNRVDVRGLVVSMSGFSGGAVDQCQQYANTRVMLLFGPQNVRSLVDGADFEEMLDEKYGLLLTRREVLFE